MATRVDGERFGTSHAADVPVVDRWTLMHSWTIDPEAARFSVSASELLTVGSHSLVLQVPRPDSNMVPDKL